jgi:hypothetical protein
LTAGEVLTAHGSQSTLPALMTLNRKESDDLITISFSDKPAEGIAYTDFSSNVIQEFSFSGLDARASRPYSFRRDVRDLSFLNAPYIRVYNHGIDGWAGDNISLTVDGNPVLVRQSLYPRKGHQPQGGIEKFNRKDWETKNYWEEELQKVKTLPQS